jgi:membrane complex biogenesis BtpA family protein
MPVPLHLPPRALIGMVHAGPLPGTPFHAGESVELLAARAAEEARLLERLGFDALILENMHDRPYVHGPRLGPEITASMTRIADEIVSAVGCPVGLQILSGGNTHALAVAHAAGGSFIRCENFVFSHVADEGLLAEAEAGPLLRYRKTIGADHIAICCDIKKKHASHALTADISLADACEAAQFFGADAVIITGTHTGHPTDPADVAVARNACTLPVLVGSGVTPDTVRPLFQHADALIVGSFLKRDGKWHNPLDESRARAIVQSR